MRASLVLLAALAAGGQNASAAASAPPAASEVASVRFHVEGMACEQCSARLSAGLRKLDGVIDAEAHHKQKEAIVRYDPSRVTPQRIKQEIERLGFEAS